MIPPMAQRKASFGIGPVWKYKRHVFPEGPLATGDGADNHQRLLASRVWGLDHLDLLADQAWATTGVARQVCRDYLGDLDYGFSYRHLAGLTDFFRRLAADGLVPDGSLSFITAA